MSENERIAELYADRADAHARLADVVALADEWAQATCTCGGVSACLPCQYADRIAAAAVAADPADTTR